MRSTRRAAEPSRRRWTLAIGVASVLASSLPLARAGCAAIAGGGSDSFALKSEGTVWSWGSGYRGVLGNGSTADSSLPVRVSDPSGTAFLTGITAIAGGGLHALALRSDDTLWAWGD